MTPLTLVIGNKNYSSWSLRPWLLLRQAGIPFEEVRVPLYLPESAVELAAWSPSGKVPAARRRYPRVGFAGNERFPDKQPWPADAAARAVARLVSAEASSPPRPS